MIFAVFVPNLSQRKNLVDLPVQLEADVSLAKNRSDVFVTFRYYRSQN